MELWQNARPSVGSLHVQQYGSEICENGHQYGPAVRDHHLIHFVASGKGEFWAGNKVYPLRENQAFIIFPGQLTTYRADARDPWSYAWVGYAGLDAEMLTSQVGLTRENPVFAIEDPAALFAMLGEIASDSASLRLGSLAALGTLYRLLALMGQWLQRAEPDIHQEYYQRALWFMEGNYERPIQITDVAAFVGLSRSQLFRVFQSVAGTSPKAILTDIRMQRAHVLLQSTSLTTEEIAASVGVSSSARLGALCREVYGMTLGALRREGETMERRSEPRLGQNPETPRGAAQDFRSGDFAP